VHVCHRENRGHRQREGPGGWFALSDATVYFDHPQHAQAEHTLNIDFLNPGKGPSGAVAVELTR